MKRVLIAKELAGMRPFLILLVVMTALTVFDLVTSQLSESYFDLIRFGRWEWNMEAGFFAVLGFALGSGLIAREQEEGTLAFLDGLPVRRRTIFAAKLGVTVAVIFLYAIIAPLLAWGVVLLLRRSVDVPVEWSALATLLARYALLSAWAVALGLLCGFMRQMSWLLFALLAMGVALLEQVWPRAGAALNPTGLVADGWATHGWDSDVVAVSAIVTLLCLALAYALFAGAGGARMGRLAALGQHRVTTYGLYMLAAGLFVTFAVVSTKKQRSGDASGATPAVQARPGAPQGATRITTAHYSFSIPAGQAVPAGLAKYADAAFDHVTGLLATGTGTAGRIDVDLSGSVAHTAGVAALNRIRMHPGADWFDTLAHETVHVLAARLAGAERNRELEKLALFNEGLAQWAEPSRQGSAALRAQDDLAAAIVMRRRLLSGDQLLRDGAIERNLDWQMKYPLGAKLVETLVARYGRDAPAAILRTLARPDFPRDLEGYELYRTTFQLAGFDLNLVMFDYATRLKELARRYAPVIDAMPRPRGRLLRRGERVGVIVALDRPLAAGQSLVVRFRPKEDSAVHEYRVVKRLDSEGARPVAWQSVSKVASNEVCFQTGVAANGRVAYEPWGCLPLRAAASRGERIR